jgi:hypothetical protein
MSSTPPPPYVWNNNVTSARRQLQRVRGNADGGAAWRMDVRCEWNVTVPSERLPLKCKLRDTPLANATVVGRWPNRLWLVGPASSSCSGGRDVVTLITAIEHIMTVMWSPETEADHRTVVLKVSAVCTLSAVGSRRTHFLLREEVPKWEKYRCLALIIIRARAETGSCWWGGTRHLLAPSWIFEGGKEICQGFCF